jgi:multidrug efflux pump subunit AcrA (membrane-fusion protein)
MFSLGFLLPVAGFSQGPQRNQRSAAVDSELARSRAEVLQKTKETRAGAEKLLALHEAELKRVTEEYEQRRELYYQGLISRVDVIQAEERVAKTTLLIRDDKRFLAETDTALTEFTMRDELLRLPGLALGGYSETASLLRFNGAAGFTLAEVAKIERFFTSTFGRGLPISALGQTSTHDRMRFDHRNAVDVALHPESAEGQSVLNFLRQAGIPFIAFRAAVPGAATGAHIHIGKPSPRL